METRGVESGKIAAGRNGRQFVDPAEFLAEITSRRSLQRCDETGAAVRGLLDPATGRRIFIDAETLLSAYQSDR